jgi:hypothetical protein
MGKVNWAKVLDIAGMVTAIAVLILGLLTVLTLQGYDILPDFKSDGQTHAPPWTYFNNDSMPWDDSNYSWNHSEEVR